MSNKVNTEWGGIRLIPQWVTNIPLYMIMFCFSFYLLMRMLKQSPSFLAESCFCEHFCASFYVPIYFPFSKICQIAELLGQKSTPYLTCSELQTFPQSLSRITFPLAIHKSSNSFICTPVLVWNCLCDLGSLREEGSFELQLIRISFPLG